MSRIGNVPIVVPSNINVKSNNAEVEITYQSQSRVLRLPKNVEFTMDNNIIKLLFTGSTDQSTKDWGTFRQNLNNVIKGFSTGFSKKVFLVGTGFKADVKGSYIRLYLGHSHPFYYLLPEGIKVTYEKPSNSLTFTGTDKDLLGNVVKNIVNLRRVEPYKGKGVRIDGQFVVRKESKTKK
jgi:large subunit ribosomal protein L6